MAFNFHNMEEELVNTVMENEEFSNLSGQIEEKAEEDLVKKSPGKFAAAFLLAAAVCGSGIFGLQAIPVDYAYGQTESLYQECLASMAEEDWQTAKSLADDLLTRDSNNLQYLALKNTICQTLQDKEGQEDTLLSIIKEDQDNYPAYDSLLKLYVADHNAVGIQKLADKAPNADIADLVKACLVDKPQFSLEPGTYAEKQDLEILFADRFNVYYTLDGSSPVEGGSLYINPIVLEDGLTKINAVCCNENGVYGEISSAEYQIGDAVSQNGFGSGRLVQPTVYPAGGTYTSSQMITIDVPMGSKAYYSWDTDKELTVDNGTLYSGGISMPNGTKTLSVIVADEEGNTSPVKQVQYTYQPQE